MKAHPLVQMDAEGRTLAALSASHRCSPWLGLSALELRSGSGPHVIEDFDEELPATDADLEAADVPDIDEPPVAPEIQNRLGVYAAEINHLLNLGWEVRMRHDPGLGSLTAEILHKADGVVGRSAERLTVWTIPEDSIAHYAMKRSVMIARLAGHPIRWEEPIHWTSVMHLGFYAAFRDWYVGEMPVNFPFKPRSEAA